MTQSGHDLHAPIVKDEPEILKNLSQSWSRLAGQIDRYNALMREQRRIVLK